MPTKERQDSTPVKVNPEGGVKVSREEIDEEIRVYLHNLHPSVDRLRAAADRAVTESRALRMEARKTATTASQSGMKRVVLKDPQK